jgi:hypothetical protein
MGFDPSKGRMTQQEKAEDARARAEGKRNRQTLIDALTDILTGPEIDSSTLSELRACWLYFPEGKKMVDQIEAIYSDKPELRKAVLLSAIIAILNRLIA